MDKIICTNCGTDNATNSRFCRQCGYELPKPQPKAIETPVPQSAPPAQERKKKLIGIIVSLVAFALASWAVQHLFFKPPSYDKVMMEIASELNKTCPIMIDAETRLDNAIALPPNTIQYNYTLINMDKATADTVAMKNYVEPSIVNNIRTNPQMEFQREHKTTMNYYYKDRNGQYLFLVSVTPEQYQ